MDVSKHRPKGTLIRRFAPPSPASGRREKVCGSAEILICDRPPLLAAAGMIHLSAKI
jgi:hypothetical protein